MTRRGAWALVAAAFVALLAVAIWRLFPSEQPFHDYIAKLRAEGAPTTFDELNGPMPLDAENAAPEIEAAYEAFVAEFGPPADWPAGAWNWEIFPRSEEDLPAPEDLAALTAFADRARPFAERIATAISRPRCRFALRQGTVLPGLTSGASYAVGNSLPLLDDVARHASDAAVRLDACRTLALIAARLETRGFSETRLAMDAADRCAGALRAGLADRSITPSLARATLDPLLRARWLPRLPACVRFDAAEFAFEYGALLAGRYGPTAGALERAARDVDDTVARMGGSSRPRRWEPGHADEIVAACEFARATAAIATDSYAAFHREYRALEERHEPPHGRRGSHFLAAALTHLDAEIRLARVALAAAEFREERGELPASLDELRPRFDDGIPLDPFTGASFAYLRTADGVRVSSPGYLPEEPRSDQSSWRDRGLVWELQR
jgi:hypothetical protein